MLILDAVELLNLFQTLLGTEFQIRNVKGPLPSAVKKTMKTGAKKIRELADSLELRVTANTARNMLADCETAPELHRAVAQIANNLFMELDGRKFYGPLHKYAGYFEEPKLFGDTVFSSFSSANNDISEAGTCLALERGTAAVMHLMRVMECGLAALAKTLNVPKQNDWGRYLSAIDAELAARYKAAGARTAKEQFYSEAAFSFDQVRRACRNPTMHVEHNYSPERAREILEAVKSFMTHLAAGGVKE